MAQAQKIIKGTFKKIDAKLECPICQCMLKEAKLLPCFHVFCKLCLERLVVHGPKGQTLTCPTCRHYVTLPDNGVTGLQTNFQTERLMEIRNVLEDVKRTDCENCKSSTASKFCQQCKLRMCEKCIEMHQMWGGFKEHSLVGMEEMKANATDMLAPVKKILKCPKHTEMDAKIYCETCSELICSDCTISRHKDHKYNLSRDVLLKHKEEIAARLGPLKMNLEKLEQSLATLENASTEVNDQKSKIKEEINVVATHLHHILDQREGELLGSLEHYFQKLKKNLARQKDFLKSTQAKLSSCLEYAETAVDTGTEGEVLRLKVPVFKQIEEITAEFDPDTLPPKINRVINFIPNDKASQTYREIGYLSSKLVRASTVERTNKTVRGSGTCVGSGFHQVQQVTKLDNQATENPVQTRSYSTAITQFPGSIPDSIKIAFLKEFNGPCSATINSVEQLVISESGASDIIVLSPGLTEKILIFGMRGSEDRQFNKPYGVATDHYDNIFVVDSYNHRIQKFTSQGKFIAAVGSHGDQLSKFNYPTGICFNKTNHHLYVCDQENHRIQVLTTDLGLVRSFGSPGSEIGEFQHPKFGAFSSAKNFYVTDWGNHRVQVFTAEGEFLLAFSEKANGEKLKNPYGIAIDSHDRVYVSENGQSSINMFTVQGKFVTSLILRAQVENYSKLLSLSVDQNDSIIVSQ